MISTPYKLDLILKTDKDSIINFGHINSDEKLHFDKMKQVINNIRNYNWELVSSPDSGFNLKIPLTNKLIENNINEFKSNNEILGTFFLKKNDELEKFLNIDTNIICLKIFESQDKNLDQFINKWNEDFKYFPSLIPNIYFYGNIINTFGEVIAYYYITKKYYNYKDIVQKNDLNFTIIYFKKLLVVLDKLISKKYIYRNFALYGIGYDVNYDSNGNSNGNSNGDSNFDIVILDYTSLTLLSTNDDFFKKFYKVGCNNKKCVGYLTPYYVIDDYYDLNKNWLSRLDKFYSLGLVEIILSLFYEKDNNLVNIYNFLIGPSILEAQLHYVHFHSRFNNKKNIHNLTLGLNKLQFRYCEVNPIFESRLEYIILNLLSTKYDEIHYPIQIFNIIEKIELSDNEFKINHNFLDKIYNPKNNDYNNTSHDVKKKIISQDVYEYGTNNNKINDPNDFTDYFNLYKKYKIKYLNLKNKYNP